MYGFTEKNGFPTKPFFLVQLLDNLLLPGLSECILNE